MQTTAMAEDRQADADNELSMLTMRKNVQLEAQLEKLNTMLRHTAQQRADLSDEAIRLKNESDSGLARAAALQAEKEAALQEAAEVRARWASQIESAVRENEELRAQIVPPAEINATRIRAAEEAVAPWRAQCKALASDADAARAAAATARRELEALRATHETAMMTHQAALHEAQGARETAEAELRARLELAQQESAAAAEPLERARKLLRENTALAVAADKSAAEADELRADVEALKALRDQMVRDQAQAAGEERAQAKLAQVERESLERKAAHLTQECEAANLGRDRLHDNNLRLEGEMRALRAQLDDAHHALLSEQAAGASRVADGTRELDKLKLEMERRHAESLRREGVLQRSREEISAQLAHAQRASAADVARVRDEEGQRARKAEAECARLREELAAAHSLAAASAADARDRLDSALGEVASMKAELHGAALAKTAASDEAERNRRLMTDAESRAADATAALQSLRAEYAEVAAQLQAAQSADARNDAGQVRAAIPAPHNPPPRARTPARMHTAHRAVASSGEARGAARGCAEGGVPRQERGGRSGQGARSQGEGGAPPLGKGARDAAAERVHARQAGTWPAPLTPLPLPNGHARLRASRSPRLRPR